MESERKAKDAQRRRAPVNTGYRSADAFNASRQPPVRIKTLAQQAAATRALTPYVAAFEAIPHKPADTPRQWYLLLDLLAARDPLLASRLQQWPEAVVADILDQLRHGHGVSTRVWRFTREISCTIVHRAGAHEVIVETQYGRHHKESFRDRATAERKAEALRSQLLASWQWTEDGARTEE